MAPANGAGGAALHLSLNELFERGKALLVAGDAAGAAEDARHVLQVRPDAWPALHLLAVAQHRCGKLEAAREAFEAALTVAPDNADIHKNYADLLGELGETAAAIPHYRRSVAARPDHVDAWLSLSVAEAAAGSATAAREAVEAAVRAGPDDARAWAMLGWRRQADGDGEAAEQALQRAVALAPGSAVTVRAMAELEADRGGDAGPLFDRAAVLDPTDPITALARAVARHRAGETEGATAAIESLAAAIPGWTAPYETLTKLAIADGRSGQAKAELARAVETRPRDAGLWGVYLQTLARLQDHVGVLAAARQARAQLGDHPMLPGFVAVALDETGDHEQAATLLRRLDLAGDNPVYAEARIRNFLRTGRIEAARQRAADGVVQPGGWGLWAYLATAWRMLDDPQSKWLEAPGFVQAIDIEDGAELAAEATPVLRRLHTDRAAPLGQTLRGGSQTEGHLFLRRAPEIQRLAAALKRAVETYAAALPPHDAAHPLLAAPRQDVRFSGAWSVRLSGGGLHINHVHPDGWVSSAFYVSLPGPAPAGSNAGWLAIGEPPAELGLGVEPYAMIEPAPGRLALFPSYSWHGTRPFASGERLTVAFDAVTG